MKSTIQTLQDEITHNTLGIFWITESPLTKETLLVQEFDYFTNGQISNFLKAGQTNSNFTKNIFIQKNFGEDSFICHLQDKENDRKESLLQLKSLVDAISTERNELILVNLSSYNYSAVLEKLYPAALIKTLKL